MCGIAGRLSLDGAPVDHALLARMAAVMRHRGPDDEGFYLNAGFGMAARRLSIIDLETGHQPLSNEDGSVWVALNGEIYNHVELRAELVAHGHRFRTGSDTEVIAHLYEDVGSDCVDRLRGMFAFAVWDERRRSLLLVRDRIGKKPLYYAHAPGRALVFASELKAVVEDPTVERTIDLEALDQYVSLLYIPAPRSPFTEVRKLPPGHRLLATPSSVRIERYWDVTIGDAPASPDAALERLGEILEDATRLRLRSDVPVGAFLSGGVDSSAVVGTMQRLTGRPVMTTAIGFEEASDELPYARLVAQHLGTDHESRIVRAPSPALLERLVWHLDEPFADSSAVPTHAVSVATRERATVALSGDGGDELFGGYARHWLETAEHRLRRAIGAAGARLAGASARALPRGVTGRNSLLKLGMRPDEACARKFYFDQTVPALRARLLGPAFRDARHLGDPLEPFRRAFQDAPTRDPLTRMLYVDVKTSLPDDMLMKVDRMSMAASLEVRSPLLDHRVVELAMSLPADVKLHGRTGKHVLRRLAARAVPRAAFERPKHGFVAPVARWLRTGLAGFVEETICSPRALARGYFEPREVRNLWQRHRDGRENAEHAIWMLVVLELWHRTYVDLARSGAPAAPAAARPLARGAAA